VKKRRSSKMNDHRTLAVCIAAYLVIGLLNGVRAVRAIKRYHIFGEVSPKGLRIMFTTSMLLWPVDLIGLIWLLVSRFLMNRSFWHWLLGYWPALAHSANLIAHWAALRSELHSTMSEHQFHFIDSHMQELAHVLKTRYGVDVAEPKWRVEFLDDIPGVEFVKGIIDDEEESPDGDN